MALIILMKAVLEDLLTLMPKGISVYYSCLHWPTLAFFIELANLHNFMHSRNVCKSADDLCLDNILGRLAEA
jgi:hypothetical protein